jgi:hypothetical protein
VAGPIAGGPCVRLATILVSDAGACPLLPPANSRVVVRALSSTTRPSQPGSSQMKRKAERKLEMIKRIEALIAALTKQ